MASTQSFYLSKPSETRKTQGHVKTRLTVYTFGYSGTPTLYTSFKYTAHTDTIIKIINENGRK